MDRSDASDGEGARVLVEPLERDILGGVRELEGEAGRTRVDLGLIPLFSDQRPLQGLAGLIDWRSSGRLSSLARAGLCTGELGEQVLMPGDRRWPVDRLVLVGLGAQADFDEAKAREAAGRLVDVATRLGAAQVLIELPSIGIERTQTEALFGALIEAVEAALRDSARARRRRLEAAAAAEAVVEPDPTEGGAGEQEGEQAGNSHPEVVGAEQDRADPIAVESESDPGEDLAEPTGDADEDADAARPPEPAEDGARSDAIEATPEGPLVEDPEPAEDPEPPLHWWIVADEGVVARLRRVLSGPPRPARHDPSLHT